MSIVGRFSGNFLHAAKRDESSQDWSSFAWRRLHHPIAGVDIYIDNIECGAVFDVIAREWTECVFASTRLQQLHATVSIDVPTQRESRSIREPAIANSS
jgi:hypothetical protein